MIRNVLSALLTACVVSVPAVGAPDECHRAFRSADPIITSESLDSAAYGDFNEDGRIDVAMTLTGGARVIALNRGDVFQPLPRQILVAPPLAGPLDLGPIAATDVNGDGHLDLIYRQGTKIWVAPGKGDGTFGDLIPSTLTSPEPFRERLVDFDHDGRLDFIDYAFDAGPVTFVRSKGDGTFAVVGTASFPPPTSLQDIAIVSGDFDGDGNYDAALFATDLSNRKTIVEFLWNDGAGHFTGTQQYIDVPHDLQPLDIDGDGLEELVSIDHGSLVVLRVRNRQPAVERFALLPQDVSLTIKSAAVVDANRDGIRDIAFTTGSAVGFLFGSSGGGFHGSAFYQLRGSGLTVADINGDGIPDFACTYGHDGLAVLDGRSLAAGTPNANRVYPVGLNAPTIEFADFDGDGTPDLVAAAIAGDGLHVSVLAGSGGGAFDGSATTFLLDRNVAGPAILGDFDGDSNIDVAVNGTTPQNAPAKPLIRFGSKSGFDATPLTLDVDAIIGRVTLGPSSPPALLASTGDDIQIVTVSPGRSSSTTTIYRRPPGARISVVSSTPDGEPEFIVVTTSDVRVVARNGGQWQETILNNARFIDVIGATAADLDHDGRTDLALWSLTRLQILLQQADGSYKAQELSGIAGYVFVDHVVAVDIDGDGWVDLVLTGRRNFGDPGTVAILHNAGGAFEAYATTLTGAPSASATFAVIDAHGQPDLAIATFDGIEILRNECTPPRLRVAAIPAAPPEGTSAEIVIHALSTDGFSVGRIAVSEHGKQLAIADPDLAWDLATATWTTPPLTPGVHTYHIVYTDQFAGPSSVDIVVAARPTARRRTAGR